MHRKKHHFAVARGAHRVEEGMVEAVARAVASSIQYTDRVDVAVSEVVSGVIHGASETGRDVAKAAHEAVAGVVAGGAVWRVPRRELVTLAKAAALRAAEENGADLKAVARRLAQFRRS